MSAAPIRQSGTRHLLGHPTLSIAVCVLALGGCATFSADGGFGPVEQSARARVGKDVAWVRTDAEREQRSARVAELLAKPLSADDAVQVALLNNRGLQAAFHELGIAEADVVQAGRLPNPGFSFARLQRGDEVEHERGIHFNLARLLAAPLLQQVESRRFAQTQATVTMQMLSLAFETRKAYIDAVAADESVRYLQQVKSAAEASAELARRMASVGNWNKLQQAREQGFYADAALNLARAERAQVAARERLTRLMGLWGTQTQFQLPERLPDLPREAERAARHRAARDGRAPGRAGREGGHRTARAQPRPHAHDALHQRARVRRRAQLVESVADAARLRSEPGAAALRLGRRACREGRGALHAGDRPRRRDGGQRPLAGARGVPRVPRRATTSRATTATRSCRCASASPTRTCCATTAC